MKRFAALLTLALLLVTSNSFAQSRGIGAQELIIGDGTGGKLTIVYTGGGDDTLYLDGSGLGALPEGSEGQTLRHNGSTFESSSALTNDGSIVGLNGGVSYAFRTIDEDNTGSILTSNDHVIKLDVGSDSISVTMPEPSPGRVIRFMVNDVCGECEEQIYIWPNSGEEIAGDTFAYILATPEDLAITFISDGTNWYIMHHDMAPFIFPWQI